MSKEIEKLQTKLKEAIFEQERKKVRYDAHVIVTEGHRRQLSDVVEQNQNLMHELMDAGKLVDKLNNELHERTKKENEGERESVQ